MKTKNLKFNFDTESATAINTSYEKGRELLYKVFEVARLFDYVNVLEGVKSGDLLPLLNFNPTFVAGSCGYTDGNDVIASDATITTKALKSDVTLCPSDLAGTTFERYLPAGVNIEDLSFAEALEIYMVKRYALAIQNMATNGSNGTNAIDGLITKAYASGSGCQEVTGSAPTASDALTKLMAVYQKMSGGSLNTEAKPLIIVGNDWLRLAAMQAFNDNRLAYNFQIDGNGGFILPTTNIRVQGVDALNSTNKLLAGSSNHMIVGTDLKDDMANLKIWYSEDNQEIRSTIKFRLGTALAFPSDMVIYKVS